MNIQVNWGDTDIMIIKKHIMIRHNHKFPLWLKLQSFALLRSILSLYLLHLLAKPTIICPRSQFKTLVQTTSYTTNLVFNKIFNYSASHWSGKKSKQKTENKKNKILPYNILPQETSMRPSTETIKIYFLGYSKQTHMDNAAVGLGSLIPILDGVMPRELV